MISAQIIQKRSAVSVPLSGDLLKIRAIKASKMFLTWLALLNCCKQNEVFVDKLYRCYPCNTDAKLRYSSSFTYLLQSCE